MDLLTDFKRIKPLLAAKDKRNLGILLVLMFFGAILEAVGLGAIPAVIAIMQDPQLLNRNELTQAYFPQMPEQATVELMVWLSLAFLGLLLFKGTFLTAVYYLQSRLLTGIQLRLSGRIFQAYQHAPYLWHLSHNTAQLQRNVLQTPNQIVTGWLFPLLDICLSAFMMLFIVGVMVLSTPLPSLWGILITGVGFLIVSRGFRNTLNEVGRTLYREGALGIQAIQQGLGAIVDVRTTRTENFFANVFAASRNRQRPFIIKRTTIQKSTPLCIEFLALAGLFVVVGIMIGTGTSLEDSIPVLALLGAATLRMKQISSRVANAYNTMQASRAALPELQDHWAELQELESAARTRSNKRGHIQAFEQLAVRDLVFTYPETPRPALDGVNLDLKRGESIALVGPTGCGKSTLVNILLGLIEPQEGRVEVNGCDIFCDLQGWRARTAYIPQTIFLCDGTLRENIAFGIEPDKVDEALLAQVIEMAQLKNFIDTLDLGIETRVGERGVRLSGGQRQRIGIARALYTQPDVLIMDEATSALDNRTEADLMETVNRLQQSITFIMIAHRLKTVENCQRLYFLQAGEVAAVGTYTELLRDCAAFQHYASVPEADSTCQS